MSLDATLSKLHLHICTHMTLHDLLWPLISDLENSSRPHCCRKYMSKFYLEVSSIYRIYNSSVVVMWPWPLIRDLDTWSVCFTSVSIYVSFGSNLVTGSWAVDLARIAWSSLRVLDLWPYDLEKVFSNPIYMTNICGKFHWNPSTK